MLDSVDRIQIAVRDTAATAKAWSSLLDAEVARRDKLAALGARRSVLAVGTSEVELLEPDGAGPVEDFLRTRGAPGLYAAGFAARDVAALADRLQDAGVRLAREGEQLFVGGVDLRLPGLNVVVSPRRERACVGLLQRLYEVTFLVHDAAASTQRFAQLFGLDAGSFVPIESAQYGYTGALTLFAPDRLDRVEIIDPHDRQKTMGRFFTKRGPSLYMCYAETDRPDALRDRAREHAPEDWTGPAGGAPPDNQFLHPRALGGVMLGVSRTTFAWTWSGSPARVQPAT